MVDYLSNIIINIFAIAIMFILLINSMKKQSAATIDQKLYNHLIFAVIFMLIIDTIPWIVDKKTFQGAEFLNRFFNTLLYLFGPLTSIFWACYVDYKIFDDEKGLKKRLPYYLIPAVLNAVISFANFFTDIVFEIKPGNEYHRLPLSYISFVLAFGYMIFTTILTFIYRRKIRQRNFLPLFIYIILPAVCCFVQTFFYGFSLMYMGVALSMLIVYVRVQNDMAVTDFLTGLSNKRHLEDYLKNECNHLKDNEIMYGIMIDIDDFKNINDKFGHATGDQALEEISRLFLKSVRIDDFVARYAGDEFVIILIRKEEDNILDDIASLRKNESEYNKKSILPFKLLFSLGYSRYNKGEKYDEFLKRIDDEMYKNKSEKRERRQNS